MVKIIQVLWGLDDIFIDVTSEFIKLYIDTIVYANSDNFTNSVFNKQKILKINYSVNGIVKNEIVFEKSFFSANRIDVIEKKMIKLNIKQRALYVYLKTLDNNTDYFEIDQSTIIINHTLKTGVVIAHANGYTGFYYYVYSYLSAMDLIVNTYKYRLQCIFTEDTFPLYKDLGSEDLYKIVFKQTPDVGNLSKNGLFIQYFGASEIVIKTVNLFKKKYNIISEKCIGVYYRGTDKEIEVKLPDPLLFLEKTKEIECEQIFLQTDQQQVVDLFVDFYKEKCIVISELPTSTTNSSVHHHQTENKVKNAIELNSALRIISECKDVILNPSSWVSQYILRLTENKTNSKIHTIT